MSINHLVEFFETNGIITVYDEGPNWDQNISYENTVLGLINLPLVITPPRGSKLRALLTSLPEHFLNTISEEDRIKNMQELTKIRDSMTPESLSALHSEYFSNASMPWAVEKASMDLEAAKVVIIQKALNPQLVVGTTLVGNLLQAICPFQYMDTRIYANSDGFTNLHKFYHCLIEDISNKEKFENKILKKQNDSDVKTKKEVGNYGTKMNITCEIVEYEEYDVCQATPDEFVFPVFQNDELIRSDKVKK
jgi:hypothetical protein